MSKHYHFQHICGHTGIGPLLRTEAPSATTEQQPTSSSQALQSINLSLPFQCPFCAITQPYLDVAAGDGLLAILEPSSPSIPSSTFEWRVLRICAASEISSADWYLAHASGQHYPQIAWIPKPCGTVRADGSGGEEVRNWSRPRRQLDCSWRQALQGSRQGLRTRLPGMWSALMANLMLTEQNGEQVR